MSAEALTQFSKALNAGKDGKMAKAKVQRNKRNAFGGVIKEVWVLQDVLLTSPSGTTRTARAGTTLFGSRSLGDKIGVETGPSGILSTPGTFLAQGLF